MVSRFTVALGAVWLVGLSFFGRDAAPAGRPRAESGKDSAQADPPAGAKQPRAAATAPGDQAKANLDVLETKFDPIHEGTNVVRVKVKNVSRQEQVLGIHIQSYSRFGGFGKAFFERLGPGEVRWTRFEFEIPDPIPDAVWIRLQFYNPPSAEQNDLEKPFKQAKYAAGDLERRNLEEDRQRPATEAQRRAVAKVLQQIREHVKLKQVDAAWQLLGDRCQRELGRDKFRQGIEEGIFAQMGFLDFQVDSIVQHSGYLRVEASRGDDLWLIDVVDRDGRSLIDSMRLIRSGRDWKERLLPKMQNRSTPHFDVYYVKGSTAESDIGDIVARREEAFRAICSFLGKDSDVRICLVFFESQGLKAAETGHQGAGWAYGDTIVEVYNKREKLDPYHEMVHVLMRPYGSPPAVLNEGFAVFMAERLEAQSSSTPGGKQSSVHERVKESKEKGQWIPLEELTTYVEIGSASSRPLVAYPEAGSFVRFLIDAYGKDRFLAAYKTLRNSRDPAVQRENVRALARAYDKPPSDLAKEWEKAFSAGRATGSPPPRAPEPHGKDASPDKPAKARDGVGPGLPEDFRVGEHFCFYGSSDVDRRALDDPVNNLLLKACFTAAAEEDLRPLGIAGLQERLARLEASRLIKRANGRYAFAFPAVTGAKRAQLQRHAEQAATRLLPLGRTMAKRVQGHLKDRQEMAYHVLWSVVMDGPDAWKTVQEEVRRQVRTGDLSMDDKGWVIYPDHPSAVGTNTYDLSSGRLQITWSRRSPRPGAMRDAVVRHEDALMEAVRKNLPVQAAAAREALAAWGLVDERGNVRLLVLDSERDAAAVKDYRELGREFARQIVTHLDPQKTAEMLEAPPGVACLIAYHEICWQLLQGLTEERILSRPGILSQGSAGTQDARQLVSLAAIGKPGKIRTPPR